MRDLAKIPQKGVSYSIVLNGTAETMQTNLKCLHHYYFTLRPFLQCYHMLRIRGSFVDD